MSGICGLYHFAERPVETPVLEQMAQALAHRGPDGVHVWHGGPVGFGHCALHTTPEAVRERQPMPDNDGALWLTFDGRVDNRDELRDELQAHGATLRDDTDAALVLAAYQLWGADCPAKLLGEFALALWDGRRRQLFCARDHFGLRPFYYFANNHAFLFASEMRPLLDSGYFTPRVNEGFLGEYLATDLVSQTETVYQQILRLPPAHWLTVCEGRVTVRRYWDIAHVRDVRHRTDDDYAEHFYQLFAETVRQQSRAVGSAGVLLSGGLDSTSVVAVMRDVNPSAEIASFSLSFPGLDCDESSYVRETAAMLRLRARFVTPQPHPAGRYAEDVRRYRAWPDYPNDAFWDGLRRAARDAGVRVLLTGIGGDHWLTGSRLHHADSLRQGRWLHLARQLRDEAAALGGSPLRLLWGYGVKPLAPDFLRAIYRHLRPRDIVPQWINADWARRIGLAARLAVRYPTTRLALRNTLTHASRGWLAHELEANARINAAFGLEMRHPFHARRLVEFCLGLPTEQRWRGAQTKFIMRRALRGRYPESIRQRNDKANFSHVFTQDLAQHGGTEFFTALQMAERGWLNAVRVREMCCTNLGLHKQENPPVRVAHIYPLWHILGAELLTQQEFPC